MLTLSAAPLLTERLVLRPLAAADAPAFWPVLRDPALYQWIARAPPASLAEVEARFARIAQRTAPGRDDQWLNWTVWRRETALGLVEATARPDHSVLVAYLFASGAWGRGYATEALAAAIAALEQAGAARFEATIDTRNAASRALVARLGFHRAETRASDDIIAGAPSQEEVWRRARG